MAKRLKKTSFIIINYLSILPLLVFLISTNQNKELDRLLTAAKASSNF